MKRATVWVPRGGNGGAMFRDRRGFIWRKGNGSGMLHLQHQNTGLSAFYAKYYCKCTARTNGQNDVGHNVLKYRVRCDAGGHITTVETRVMT